MTSTPKSFPVRVTLSPAEDANVSIDHDITCVKGSNEDLPLITELASKADIVLNAADADSEAIIEAILEGCKRHLEDTKSKSVFIHTSGTAILGDGGEGTFNPLTPVYDVRPEPIDFHTF
jgi:hypothetical protein